MGACGHEGGSLSGCIKGRRIGLDCNSPMISFLSLLKELLSGYSSPAIQTLMALTQLSSVSVFMKSHLKKLFPVEEMGEISI